MTKGGFVYILSNFKNNVFYIGVTSTLYFRTLEHKSKKYPNSFSAKYNCDKLVYFEFYNSIEEAIKKEKQLKKWNRQWKIELIEKDNPSYEDLTESVKEF